MRRGGKVHHVSTSQGLEVPARSYDLAQRSQGDALCVFYIADFILSSTARKHSTFLTWTLPTHPDRRLRSCTSKSLPRNLACLWHHILSPARRYSGTRAQTPWLRWHASRLLERRRDAFCDVDVRVLLYLLSQKSRSELMLGLLKRKSPIRLCQFFSILHFS